MNDLAARFLVRHHRILLVTATLLIAIGGSRVASDVSSIPDLFMLVGGGLLLFTADGGREAAELANQFPGERRRRAQVDLLKTHSPYAPQLMQIAIAATVVGLLLLAALPLPT